MNNFCKNLKEINDTSSLTVSGSDFTLVDNLTRKIYVTSKGHMDKLFKEMGYRNVNVINILEEFAGKVVSNVGSLVNSSLWIDEDTDSFIVTSENAVSRVRELEDSLKDEGFSFLKSNSKNNYHEWDQYFIKSLSGDEFCIYVNLLWEYVSLYSLSKSDKGIILGLEHLGNFKLAKSGCVEDIIDIVTTHRDMTDYSLLSNVKFSVSEYVELLCVLGLARKTRKSYIITEDGEEYISEKDLSIEESIDKINSLSWIQSHTTFVKDSYENICKLITKIVNKDKVSAYQVEKFYKNVSLENSDYFLF